MDIGRTISEINSSFEAAVLKHVGAAAAAGACEIRLAEPFFGTEWGVAEWNVQLQKWRWLGPRGQSHLYLKLDTETDHAVRIYIHTATSAEILDALTVLVNGVPCKRQGLDWGADLVASKWCIVDRGLVAKRKGIAKITWSLLPAGETPNGAAANGQPGHLPFARSIAFSTIRCAPYPGSGASLIPSHRERKMRAFANGCSVLRSIWRRRWRLRAHPVRKPG